MTDNLARAQKLFDLGGHLGHRKSRLHPKARPYIYDIVDGTTVIDLEETLKQLDLAKKMMLESAQNGKTLLVVATKKTVAQSVMQFAKDANIYFITTKWLPGLLTNFDTIAKNTKKLVDLKRQKDAGEWAKYVKHEQVSLDKQVRKLEKLYGGVVNMHRLPDVLFVIDIKREKNAITEAHKNKIPVIAIVDTNCDPNEVNYPIMLNDDAPEAVINVAEEIITSYSKNVKKEAPKDVIAEPPKVISQAPKVTEVSKKSEEVEITPKIEDKVDTTAKTPSKKVTKVAKPAKKKASTKKGK